MRKWIRIQGDSLDLVMRSSVCFEMAVLNVKGEGGKQTGNGLQMGVKSSRKHSQRQKERGESQPQYHSKGPHGHLQPDLPSPLALSHPISLQ